MTGAVLQARGLSKSFASRRAVHRVDLQIDAGEFAVLLGPNGAGKTTLFQMLSGLFAPDQGNVRIAGHDLRRQAVRALAGVGVVFQQPTVDLDRSVLRNLRFQAALHGLPRRLRDARIHELLGAMRLLDRARDPVASLSGGNRRRVEVARALLHQPRLLLMDEASVGLDPASRRDLLLEIRRQSRDEGRAVLWATHLVDEAQTADRVLVMNHGRLIAEGSPHQLLAGPGASSLEEVFLQLTGAEFPAAVSA